MSFFKFLFDRKYSLIVSFIISIIIYFVLSVTRIDSSIIIYIILLYYVNIIFYLFTDFRRKYKFFSDINNKLNELDKKYLIMETINEPSCYENKLIYDILYDINYNVNEFLDGIVKNDNDFHDYVEMWIHEVKIPLASINLKCHNNSEFKDIKVLSNRINNLLDSILYYVRSKDTDRDFSICECNIKDIIREVSLNVIDDIRDYNIEFLVKNVNYKVFTDKKWLIFIINQIINNSIKYRKNSESLIKISCDSTDDFVTLNIYDNGIGIKTSDINRVFDKSFTGFNGKFSKSTGMGLYIVKNLIDKLGHDIFISSEFNEYTLVSIKFGINKINITKK